MKPKRPPLRPTTKRLIDQEPHWLGGYYQGPERLGTGVSFLCPHCKTRLAVAFANPIDGKEPLEGFTHYWQRSGETFETLTLSPSIDASKQGHWHGFLTNGWLR